jgi:hypothetical protein
VCSKGDASSAPAETHDLEVARGEASKAGFSSPLFHRESITTTGTRYENSARTGSFVRFAIFAVFVLAQNSSHFETHL